MKKFIALTAALVLLGSTSAFALITGSAHDFTSTGTGGYTAETEICRPCHTPHNALRDDDILWNHTTTGTTFSLYSGNGSFSASATIAQPNANSLLCLSCHDGTVAVDSYGTSPTTTYTVTGAALLGTSLKDDHPISFTWANEATLYNFTSGDTTAGTNAVLPMFNDQMQCATCHDVHQTVGVVTDLLRQSNAASALCLDCHLK